MSTSIPFAFSILTVVALVVRFRGTAFWTALLALTSFVLIGSGWPAALVLDRVQVNERLAEPAWGERNVIVLLGWFMTSWPSGEITTDLRGSSRILEAARLYRACRAGRRLCRVLASGGDPLNQGRPEAEAMAEDLERLGVARADLILEPRSDNTFQNARESAPLVEAEHPDHVTLVSSGFHLRRARLYFAHFLAIPVELAPADLLAPKLSSVPIGRNFEITDLALTEVAGIVRYYVYNALGRNPPAITR